VVRSEGARARLHAGRQPSAELLPTLRLHIPVVDLHNRPGVAVAHSRLLCLPRVHDCQPAAAERCSEGTSNTVASSSSVVHKQGAQGNNKEVH
jgi:hypothetical protein